MSLQKCFYLYTWIHLVFLSVSALNYKNVVSECGKNTPTYTLSPGDLQPFQTPSYPVSLSSGNTNNSIQCSAIFTKSDAASVLYLIFYNGHTTFFTLDDATSYPFSSNTTELDYSSNGQGFNVYFSAAPSFKFSYVNRSDSADWSAFQAVVYSPAAPMTSDCLFNGEAFNLTDSSQVIPLFTFGNVSLSQREQCFWAFNLPDGYKLKINVLMYELLDNETFSVATHKVAYSIIKKGVYYYDGPHVELSYDKMAHTTAYQGLSGTISAVKMPTAQPAQNCKAISNFDRIDGYSNSQSCQIAITSTAVGKTYQLQMTKSYIEANADTLTISSSSQSVPFVSGNIIYLEPLASTTTFNAVFTSDNSIVQAGFEVQKTEKSCVCGSRTRFMNASSYNNFFYVMDSGPGYCSNMNCTYEFVLDPNPNAYKVSFRIHTTLREGTTDKFVLYNNGQVVGVIDQNTKPDINTDFYRGQNITATFTSGNPAVDVYTEPYVMIAAFVNTDKVQYTNIQLTDDEPVASINFAKYFDGFYNVSVPANRTLEAFFVMAQFDLSTLDQYQLLENFVLVKNFSFLKQNGPSTGPFPEKYVSTTGNVQIRVPGGVSLDATIFFRILEVHTQNCQTPNNVLQLSQNLQPPSPSPLPTVIQVTGAAGPCMYTVVSYSDSTIIDDYMIALSDMSTASSNVTVVAGVDPKYPLFSFNSNDVSTWNDVTLRGPFNSFMVNDAGLATITLTATKKVIKTSFPSGTKKVKGIAFSENYSNSKAIWNNYTTSSYYGSIYTPDQKGSIFITCKFLDLGAGEQVKVGTTDITKVGQNITINSGVATIYYNWNVQGKRGFLLEFTSSEKSATQNVVYSFSLLILLAFSHML